MGRRLETFEDLAGLGVEHFQHLFQALEGAQLVDIMRITGFSSVCGGGRKPLSDGRGYRRGAKTGNAEFSEG